MKSLVESHGLFWLSQKRSQISCGGGNSRCVLGVLFGGLF